MRKIKFRAICKKECNHEQRLEKGAMYYQQTIIEEHFDSNDLSISSKVPVLYFIRERSVLYKGKPFYFKQGFNHVLLDNDWIKMQFIGLYDLKNREVYDGDIVKSTSKFVYLGTGKPTGKICIRTYRIVYLENEARYGAKIINPKYPKKYIDEINQKQMSRYFEVIGNIHENPELLKEAKKMSWDVSLIKDKKLVEVEHFTAGGTYPIGGTDEAELNITYNYSEFYYAYLDKKLGLEWLRQKQAKDCIERLENAVKELGIKQNENYWSASKGNAGYALNILLKWAKENPEAKFEVN